MASSRPKSTLVIFTFNMAVGEDTDNKISTSVPGPPLIIYFPNVTYTMARIVWDPPVEPNGILTGYMVSYRLLEAALNTTELVNLEVSTREYTATKLEREKYYVFGVTARTHLGWGDTALVKVYTMHNRSKYGLMIDKVI